MKICFVILTFACLSFINASEDPTPPVWPNQFEQTFSEQFVYGFLKGTTKGRFFYDYTNRTYRVDRDNGKYDRYCGTIYKFRDAACSHIVSGGNRFLYFPQKNYCCNCCNDEHGCGILKPDWLSGATFLGLETDADGTVLEKWDKPGMQSNYYYSTHDENRIMRKIDQVPNDIQDFDVNSFYRGIRDSKVFDLPSQCDPEFKCPFLSICTLLSSR